MSDAVTVSVVSHRQNKLVNKLVEDLDRHCRSPLRLLLTENVPDPEPLQRSGLHATKVVANVQPKGFGANHNAAFRHCRTPFFCVLNPDVRLIGDPFPDLISILSEPTVGAAGPLIRSPAGRIEDSARRFPTLTSLTCKLFVTPLGPDYPSDRGPVRVDWVAGMFILLRSETYAALRGFDERYFLYYEDVDLCRRLRNAGRDVVYVPHVEVLHDAQRASRQNPRLAVHHARSMLRYLLSASRAR